MGEKSVSSVGESYINIYVITADCRAPEITEYYLMKILIIIMMMMMLMLIIHNSHHVAGIQSVSSVHILNMSSTSTNAYSNLRATYMCTYNSIL